MCIACLLCKCDTRDSKDVIMNQSSIHSTSPLALNRSLSISVSLENSPTTSPLIYHRSFSCSLPSSVSNSPETSIRPPPPSSILPYLSSRKFEINLRRQNTLITSDEVYSKVKYLCKYIDSSINEDSKINVPVCYKPPEQLQKAPDQHCSTSATITVSLDDTPETSL